MTLFRPLLTTQSFPRSRRPWWLLLTLVLFFAGQSLAAAHWHDDSLAHKGKGLDSDCALCVYSSTATAAFSAVDFQTAVVIAAAVWFTHATGVHLVAIRFFDSRAPPFQP
jgi:hypothetical protein